MRRLSDSDCLIQCYCGSSTADGLNNLECSHCGYYVHGACYRISTGPVVCGPCSIALDQPCSDPRTQAWYLNQTKLSPAQREEHQNRALVDRLVLALSHGEHIRYFGERKNISHVYLRIKFNIDETLAEKLFQLAVCEEILLVNPDDGSVQFNQKVEHAPEVKLLDESYKVPKLKFENKNPSDDENDDNEVNEDTEGSLPPLNVELVEGDDSLDPSDDDDESGNQEDTSKKDEVRDEDFEVVLEPEIKMETLEEYLDLEGLESKTKGSKGRPRLNGPFYCQLCDYVSATKANVKKHRQSIHEKIRHQCPHCEHSATKKDHLKQHILSKHEGARYNCDLCEFSSSDPGTLRKHKVHKHEGKKYFCDQCDFIAARQGILNIHIKNKHEGVSFMCDQCPYQASCKSRLQHHKNSKHEGIRYPCDQCDYQAQKNSDLNQHKRRVHEKVRFLCDVCEYSACTSYILKVHKESKHDGKMHPCNICNFTSQYSYKTKHHVMTSHEGFRYACELCCYQATTSSNVIRHKKKVHSELNGT